jgi:tetratricopeptide (TPR) repeat protein
MRLWLKIAAPLALILAYAGGGTATAERPARRLLEENRLDEALAVCRQFEVLSSYDKDNFTDCAWVYYRTGKIEAAEKLMDRLRANFSQPEFKLLAAYAHVARKEWEKARVALEALETETKGSGFGVRVTEVKAEFYEAKGSLDTAAFIYKDVVDKKPGSGVAHWGLGRYYLNRGDMNRAQVHLEKTAQTWPKHLASRYNLAVLAISRENDRDAAKWLAECYRLNKADAGVLEQLGALYERKGMLGEAIKYWQKALAINPKSQVANEKLNRYVTKLIDKLIDAKQFKEALEQIETMAPAKKATGPILLRRGLVYRNLGKYDKAMADLLKYTNENPPDGLAFRELGICYVNLKLLDQAGANFLQATTVEPENGMNWAWLAFALEGKREYKKARDALRKAVERIREPEELTKAARKLASLEKKVGKDSDKEEEKEKAPESEAPPPPQAPKP